MKYIRGIYQNEFLLSLVLGLIATWILGSPAEASEKRVNVKTRSMIERIHAEKQQRETIEVKIERCVKQVTRAVDSEDAPAAIEACYQDTSTRIAIAQCKGEAECIRDLTID